MESKILLNDLFINEREKDELERIVKIYQNLKECERRNINIPKKIKITGVHGLEKEIIAKALINEMGYELLEIDIEKEIDLKEMFKNEICNNKIAYIINKENNKSPKAGQIIEDVFEAIDKKELLSLVYVIDEVKEPKTARVYCVDDSPVGDNMLELEGNGIKNKCTYDCIVKIGLPNFENRRKAFIKYCNENCFLENVDYDELAHQMEGKSIQNIQTIINEAKIQAYLDNTDLVGNKHLQRAINRICFEEKSSGTFISNETKKLAAYHEAGHALLGMILDIDNLSTVNIVCDESSAGKTIFTYFQDAISSETDIINKIIIAMGGKAAEKVFINKGNLGCESDIKEAYNLATSLIQDSAYKGFSYVAIKNMFGNTIVTSERKKSQTDKVITKLLNSCYKKALKMIKENKKIVESFKDALLEKTYLTKEEMKKIYLNVK